MTVSDIQVFRKILAEQGIEMTIGEAQQAYKMAKSIIKRSKKISMMDLWEMKNIHIEGMSEEEKENLIKIYEEARQL
jgi:1,2-phenylacetyl-CoA epoxidase PaaB subunit